MWYVRALPGVLAGYEAAYGTADLISAFDRMSINRPASCGEESVVSREQQIGGSGGSLEPPGPLS
jgi:hypothetical protein